MRTSLASLALLISLSAYGHSEGHGARIEGKGPQGGQLAAVVSAKEADLAEKAATVAVAEWSRTKNSVEVAFWHHGMKKHLSISKDSEVKWILLRGSDEKPVVEKQTLAASTSTLFHSFTEEQMKTAKSLEIILPNLGGTQEKQVVALSF